MTKIVCLAVVLILLAGMAVVTTAAYACGDKEHSEHPKGECSGHAEGEECHKDGECEHSEGECSGHAEGEKCHESGECKHGEGECSGHAEAEEPDKTEYAKGECPGHAEACCPQAEEEGSEKSADVQEKNGNKRNWLTKAVFAFGHAIKSAAGAVVGIFT